MCRWWHLCVKRVRKFWVSRPSTWMLRRFTTLHGALFSLSLVQNGKCDMAAYLDWSTSLPLDVYVLRHYRPYHFDIKLQHCVFETYQGVAGRYLVCKHSSHVTGIPSYRNQTLVGCWYTRSHELFYIRKVGGMAWKYKQLIAMPF